MFKKRDKKTLERVLYPFILILLIILILSENIRWWQFSKNKQQVVATMTYNPIFRTLNKDDLADYNHNLPIEEQKQYLKFTFITNDSIIINDSLFYIDYSNPDHHLIQDKIGFYQAIKEGETFRVWYNPKDPPYHVADWLYSDYQSENFSNLKENGFFAAIVAFLGIVYLRELFLNRIK